MKKLIAILLVLCFVLCGCTPQKETTKAEKIKQEATQIIKEKKPINKKPVVEQPPVEETTTPTEIPEETSIDYFNKDTEFEFEYVHSDDYTSLSYSFISPVEKPDYPMPLIVFLHGQGEVGLGEPGFTTRSLARILSDWPLEHFNAYVICPSLRSGGWAGPYLKNQMQKTLDIFIENHNVDTNKIIICGHSLGGIGTQYMAYELQDYFSAQVIVSGYNVATDISQITIPTRAYVGQKTYGEDANSENYTMTRLKDVFGEEAIYSLQTGHVPALKMSFTLDEDGNNRSDLLEWMFAQSKDEQ